MDASTKPITTDGLIFVETYKLFKTILNKVYDNRMTKELVNVMTFALSNNQSFG